MKVFFSVKSLGKKRGYITKKEFEFTDKPSTLRDMIKYIVVKSVEGFNNKSIEIPLILYLTKDEIDLQASSGKVGFDSKYNEKEADVEESVDIAIQAFEDDLYKVFVAENEVEKLDEELIINELDEVVFVKLTMLSGRMW